MKIGIMKNDEKTYYYFTVIDEKGNKRDRPYLYYAEEPGG